MNPHFLLPFFKKHLPIVLVFSLLAFENALAQCPPGSVTLNSQSDVNDFAANFPTCTTISGNLTISGADINNLSGLTALTSVTGNLTVENNAILNSIFGLHHITSVGGNVVISDNPLIPDVPLQDLASVTGNFEITNNDQMMETLPFGWTTLTTLGGNLVINFNDALTTNTGFLGLSGIGGSVEFTSNPQLTSPGLALGSVGNSITIIDNDAMTSGSVGNASMTTIPGNLYLNGNALITDGGGYINVQAIGGFLAFWENPAMTTISGLHNLQTVGGNLDFVRNDALTALPSFGSLTSVGGRLLVQDNDGLTSISASHFPNLASIGGDWNIRDNDDLTGVAGFALLGTITGRILISNNAILASVTGLGNLTSIGTNLTFFNNLQLSGLSGLASVQSVGDYLQVHNCDALASLSGLLGVQSIGGSLFIEENNSLTDISDLSNLGSINGQIKLTNNPLLTSLSGLENIDHTTITFLTLTGSAMLSACSVTSICNYVAAGGPSNVGSNATGCNGTTEIENNCPTNTFTWLGGSGSWDDPAKWDCGGCGLAPGPVDDVVINSGSPTIGSAISRAGSTIFAGTTLTVNAAVTISGPFEFAAGNINGTGSLTVTGGSDFYFKDEGQNLNVDLTIETGGTLNITGMFVPHNISGTLTNNGTVNQGFLLAVLTGGNVVNNADWNWSANFLSLTNSTTFDNFGTLTVTHDGTVNGGCSSTFTNKSGGEVIKNTATGDLIFDVGFVNEGDLTLNAGNAKLNCSSTLGGVVDGASGAIIKVSSGSSGPASFGANVTLQKFGNGTFSANGALVVNGTLELLAGTINGSGNLTVNGSMDWDGGSLNVPTNIAASASLNVETASAKNLGAALTLNGPTNHTAGTLTVSNSGSIANGSIYSITGGSIDLNGSGTQFTNTGNFIVSMDGIVLTGNSGIFENDGIFTRSGGAGILAVNCDFTNDGTINHNAGTRLELNGIPVLQNGTINFQGTEDFWTGTLTVNTPFSMASGQNWRMRRTTTLNVNLSTAADISFIPIGAANLNGTGSLTTSGSFSLENTNAANLNIPLTVGGDAEFLGSGDKNINDDLTLNGQTDLTDGSLNLAVGGSLTNGGTFNWSGGSLELAPGTTFTNSSGADFNWDFDATLSGNGATFNNDGTFSTTTGATFSIQPDLDNSGSMNLDGDFALIDFLGNLTQSGIVNIGDDTYLTLYDGGTIGNPFSFGAGAGLSFNGGTFNLNNSQSVPSDGYVDFVSGSIDGTGSFTVDGNFSFSGGVLNVPTTIQAFGQIDLFSFGTAALTEQLTIAANAMGIKSFGTLQVGTGGGILNNGDFDWQGGTFDLVPGTSFNNGGMLTMSDAFAPSPVPPFSGGFSGTGVFINTGTFQNNLTSPPSSFSFSPTFVNLGILDQSGFFSTLDFAGGFDNQSGGEVKGSGGYNFNGGLVNDGSFSPGNSPGILTVNTFENIGATLNIELDAPPFNDLLVINGSAQLGGNLVISLFGSFTPTAGDVFTIISASGGFGGTQFNPANITWPSAASEWSIAYQGNDVIVSYQSALPVELVDFQGFEENGDIRLQWQTASETDNAGFAVEHSRDGGIWDEIGFSKSKGNSTNYQNYKFIHRNPPKGLNFYRLRQIDLNGQFSFSNTISLRIGKDGDIRIFPNPTSGFLFMEIAAEEGVFSVNVFNKIGQIILSADLIAGGAQHLQLTELPEGVYLILVKKDGQIWHRARLVVAR